MPRGFIATILIAALTITGLSALPARADSDDVIKALIGLAIIGGIAAAIDDDDGDQRVQIHRDRRQPRRHRRNMALPQRCLRSFDTPRGERMGFGTRCLQRFSQNTRRLPQHCERDGWRDPYGRGHSNSRILRNSRRNGYGPDYFSARCLYREGYRVAERYNH